MAKKKRNPPGILKSIGILVIAIFILTVGLIIALFSTDMDLYFMRVAGFFFGMFIVILSFVLIIYGIYGLLRGISERTVMAEDTPTRYWGEDGIKVMGEVEEIRFSPYLLGDMPSEIPATLWGHFTTQTGETHPFSLEVYVLEGSVLPAEVAIFYEREEPGQYMIEYLVQKKAYRKTVLPQKGFDTPPIQEPPEWDGQADSLLQFLPGELVVVPAVPVMRPGDKVLPPVLQSPENPAEQALWQANMDDRNERITKKNMRVGFVLMILGGGFCLLTNRNQWTFLASWIGYSMGILIFLLGAIILLMTAVLLFRAKKKKQ